MAIRIFIDQGHNPVNPNAGAEANGMREQDMTYQVGAALAGMLERDPRFEVKVSRETPQAQLGTSTASSLALRTNMANSWPADYFISIHGNSNPDPAANGTEVYVRQQNSEAYWLAQRILTGVVERMGTRDNGVHLNPALYVLRRTNMPAALVELGYLTNAQDAEKLKSDPQGFAQGIYNGLLKYFGFAPL